MDPGYAGNVARVCPDCDNPMINLVPAGERYHCSDCDLRLVRDGDRYRLVREDEIVGFVALDAVEVKVTWRLFAPAV